MKKILFVSAILSAFYSSFAMAEIDVSARGALAFPTSNFGFVSSPSPMIAADLTYGISDLFQLGATYDHNFLSYTNNGGTGHEDFYGGLVRVGFYTGLFFDGQAGLCDRDGSGTSFSWGLGLGYEIPISPLAYIAPRFGYRALPDGGVERSMVDFGAQLTLRLF